MPASTIRSALALGRAVRDARRERGWSQSELAARASVSQPTISTLERGAGDVSMVTLWRVLAALEMQLQLSTRGKRRAASAWDA